MGGGGKSDRMLGKMLKMVWAQNKILPLSALNLMP
jgi:hypothetical protein